MERRLRLNKRTDFRRVRRSGKSFAHPLVVLIFLSGRIPTSRIGVSASRTVGGAVERNRAKRRLRAALRSMAPELRDGYDLIFLARKPIHAASHAELDQAIRELIRKAGLFRTRET